MDRFEGRGLGFVGDFARRTAFHQFCAGDEGFQLPCDIGRIRHKPRRAFCRSKAASDGKLSATRLAADLDFNSLAANRTRIGLKRKYRLGATSEIEKGRPKRSEEHTSEL